MSPRPDVRDERVNQILDAAELVFAQKGFNQARMEDIAEEAGLSKGTLYLYIKDKDDLIVSILDRIFTGVFELMSTRDLAEKSATDALLDFASKMSHGYQKLSRLLPIAYEFFSLAFRNPVVQKVLKTYLQHYLESVLPVIQRGVDSGEFKEVDPQEVAIAFAAIFEGTTLLWAYNQELIHLDQHILAGVNLLLEGIWA